MGRSVSTPGQAVEVFYLDWSPGPRVEGHEFYQTPITGNTICEHCRLVPLDQDDLDSDCGPTDWDYESEWDYLIEDLRVNVFGQFPSVWEADYWLGREDHVIAENWHAKFGVSEYCGVAAVWVVVNEPTDYYVGDKDTTGLARHWIDQVWPKVEAMYPNRLGLMGRFSNGEAVYQRTEKGKK